jgi:hypothetical protein
MRCLLHEIIEVHSPTRQGYASLRGDRRLFTQRFLNDDVCAVFRLFAVLVRRFSNAAHDEFVAFDARVAVTGLRSSIHRTGAYDESLGTGNLTTIADEA